MCPRLASLLLVLAAVGCHDSEPTAPPSWPSLSGAAPAHGLETLELRAETDADDGARRHLTLRRDGCFRIEETSSAEAEPVTSACTGCSSVEAVESLFRDAAGHRAATVRLRMGKSLAPPIRLGEWRGFLLLTTDEGEQRRAGAGDETLEAIARQLHEGVPGAPELGEDRCARIATP